MSDEQLHEHMLLFVLDGLDPDEAAEIQRLLDAGDAEAVRAYAEAAETLAALPEALGPAKPSPDVLDSLMRRAQASGRGQSPSAKQLPSPVEPPTHSPSQVIGRVGVWPKLAIAGAFVLGIGLSAVVMLEVLSDDDDAQVAVTDGDWADVQQLIEQQRTQLADQQAELTRLQSRLATLDNDEQIDQLRETIESQRLAINEQRQFIGQLQESMSLLVGPGVRQAELAGGADVPDAQGRLMWDPTTGQMRLLTRGLEPLKPGQTYQLWFVTEEGDPVSLGVFGIDEVAQTTAAYVNTVPIVPNNVNVAAISIEPAGGSPEPGPTGPIIMTGPPKSE